ncbi:SulP family inorganic anion transporter [Luteococcus sp. Sow4_B9]|uniref:SulP family inorganic anion transporter n=1 Tax=Luteococcus sp. Sow4_B9 TaxID=3438792 RepID=UPI003F97AC85
MAGERRSGLSRQSFTGKHLKNDVVAGLVNGVVSVPDGLAAGALAGVSPVTGLYASITGPIAGGVLQTTHMMSIATTSAAAIAAGQAVAAAPEGQREPALFLLVLLTGAMLAVMGLLKAGRLVRYVPYSVMQGFLFGVSLVLVLDQLAPMLGYSPKGSNEITQFIDLVTHPGSWDPQTVVIGVAALVLVVALSFTRLETWASLIALVLPTAAALALGWNQVEQVVDTSPIPRGLPALTLPDLGLLSVDLVLGAFSLAAVIAIQGAGVSQSVENLDDSRISTSRDILAQGAANGVSGLFGGLPVGASVGQTALNISAGARTRWASIFSGIWMLVFVLLLAPVIEKVPMAVLGALMVFAGAASMKVGNMLSVVRTGIAPALAFVVTLVVSLVASVPMAVVAGVLLAIVLHVVTASGDVALHLLRTDEQGRVVEEEVPQTLPSNQVSVITVRGDLFFAGANALEDQLPEVRGTERPVLVLRIRGQQVVGATLIDVLDRYAEELEKVGGRLYLSGVHPDVAAQLSRSAKLDLGDEVHVHAATPVIGESSQLAVAEARQWLAGHTSRQVEDDPETASARRSAERLNRPGVLFVPEGTVRLPRHAPADAAK